MKILLQVIGFGYLIGLSACTTIEPVPEGTTPKTYSDTKLETSGLIARSPFPNPNDVCVVLDSHPLTKSFESENHFLIACPKHEKGAIWDRKKQQQAKIIGNSKHWVLMRISM